MSWKSALTLCLFIFTIISIGCENEDKTNNNLNNHDTENHDTGNSDTDSGNSDTGNSDTGNSDTDSGNTPLTPITLDEYLTQAPALITEFMCESVYTCPEKHPLTFLNHYGRFAGKTECIAEVPSSLWGDDGYLPSDREATDAGRLEFDPQQAAECIAFITVEMKRCQSVDEFMLSMHNVCKKSFIPKVTENKPCQQSHECISDRCSFENTSECFGRCALAVEPLQEGESCSSFGQVNSCAPGLYCISNATGDSTDRYCTAPHTRQKGEQCYGIQNICSGNMICTLGDYVCDERTPLAKSGEPCDALNICKSGLACVSADPLVPLITTCAVIKTAGQPCTTHNICSSNLYCSGDTGKCTAPKPAGQPCQEHFECMSPLFCDSDANNTCASYETGGIDRCDVPTE